MFTMHPFTKLVNTVGLFYNFLVPELKLLLLSEQTILTDLKLRVVFFVCSDSVFISIQIRY